MRQTLSLYLESQSFLQALCRFGRVVSKGYEAENEQLVNIYNYQVDTRKDAVVSPR
jgi:hypothetical protein